MAELRQVDHNRNILNPETIKDISKEILKNRLQGIILTDKVKYQGGSSLD